MSLIDNERTKLTANWLNALAAGVVITGVVAPIVGVIYGVLGPSGAGYLILAGSSMIWLAMGTALHFLARRLLKGLRP
jgi:hypothetical protein